MRAHGGEGAVPLASSHEICRPPPHVLPTRPMLCFRISTPGHPIPRQPVLLFPLQLPEVLSLRIGCEDFRYRRAVILRLTWLHWHAPHCSHWTVSYGASPHGTRLGLG